MLCFVCFQLQKLQAVVCEKDVRFQEQIQKHEEELMRVTTQSQNDGELQQVQDPEVLQYLVHSFIIDLFKPPLSICLTFIFLLLFLFIVGLQLTVIVII